MGEIFVAVFLAFVEPPLVLAAAERQWHARARGRTPPCRTTSADHRHRGRSTGRGHQWLQLTH
jgi:hypothetical protein